MADPENPNSAVLAFCQLGLRDHCAARANGDGTWSADAGRCRRQSVLVDILMALIGEPAFTVLRTQQQLGYVAQAFLLQSPTWVVQPVVVDSGTAPRAAQDSYSGSQEVGSGHGEDSDSNGGDAAASPAATPTATPTATATPSLAFPGVGDDMLSVAVVVQGADYNASYISDRVFVFLADFAGTLRAVPDDQLRDTLKAVKLAKDMPCVSALSRAWFCGGVGVVGPCAKRGFRRARRLLCDLGAVGAPPVPVLFWLGDCCATVTCSGTCEVRTRSPRVALVTASPCVSPLACHT